MGFMMPSNALSSHGPWNRTSKSAKAIPGTVVSTTLAQHRIHTNVP